MKHYELLFVLKPTLTEEENKAKFDAIMAVLEKNGCEVASVDNMGVRKLAYQIDKFERGHYYVVYYKAEPSVIDEILRNLRYTEEVIRFLNIKYENKKEISNWEKLAKGTFNTPDASSEKSEKKESEEEDKKEE